MTPEEAATQWVSEQIAHRIVGKKGWLRLPPPEAAQVWDHAREDRFYREVNSLLPKGCRAYITRPDRGEPRWMAIIRWETP